MNRLKNKKVLAALAAVLVLVLVAGFFFISKKDSGPVVTTPNGIEENLPKLTPEELGMVVTLRKDKKALMFEIKNSEDIQRIEYIIEYDKEIDGERVPEGIFGEMNIGEDGITKTDFREFGTCSSGVCRYDKVVSDIKISLKIEKKDGKTYQAEKIVKL